MPINPLSAALQELAWLLPEGRLRTRLARRAARRQSPAALRAAPDDPVVLAALGLHDAALARAASPAGDREAMFARLLALAGTGRTAEAIEAARGMSLAEAEAARLARAAAAFAPAAALALAPAGQPLLRAALAFAAGDHALAIDALAEAPPGREAAALAAALAGADARWRDARAATAAMYRVDGLDSPLDPSSDRPATLDRWNVERPPPPAIRGPLVSVIVPVRNAAATLELAVGSLCRQGWRDLEILLVDDGSQDESPVLARTLAKTDSRIRCLVNVREPGVAGARNTAIAAARGALLLFHDADDWAHPAKVARHVAATGRGVGSLSASVRIDARGVLLAPLVSPFVRFAPICLMVRAAAARVVGPIEASRVGSDSEYLARLDLLFGRKRVSRDPAVLTIFSWAPASLSGDPARGIGSIQGMRERGLYRQAWMMRHAAMGLPWRRFRLSRGAQG